MNPAAAAPSSGATQNSHSCCTAHPPTNSAGPVLRAGFTDVLVTGMLIRWTSTFAGVLILVVWMYGTLVLGGRRSGYVIILLASILGSGVPVVHRRGAGLVGGRIANSSGVFFWVWTLIALGVTAMLSLVLSADCGAGVL
jgi:hypothetical protein